MTVQACDIMQIIAPAVNHRNPFAGKAEGDGEFRGKFIVNV
jgi:hypothetical protein